MNVQLDIIVLLLSGLVVLAVGLFLGYRLSLSHLEDRFQDVEEKEKTLQRRRVAEQRERYQESTSRIHRAQGEQESKNLILREELEQKKLELSIMKQDTQLDLDVLRLEKESLEEEVGRLKGDAVSFTELDHSDIPVIEALESNEDLLEVLSEDPSPAETLEIPEESVEEESANESEFAPVVVSELESDPEPPVDHDFEFPEILDRDSNLDLERLSDDIRETEPDEGLEAGELSFHWTPEPRNGTRRRKPKTPEMDQESMAARRRRNVPLENGFAIHDDAPRAGTGEQPRSAGSGTSPQILPEFKAVSTFIERRSPVAQVADSALPMSESETVREIVQLPEADFDVLLDLGYTSLKILANLSSSEVRRLSDVFGVSASQIEQAWVPTARAHLNMMNQ